MFLAFITLLSGCSSAASQETIYIGPKTNAALQSYFAAIGSVGSGAFAVSPDGRNSFYTYCVDTSCGGFSMTQDALLHCKGLAGTACVILANGTNIVRPYKVGTAGSAETVPPLKGR